jgi:hypothetical protein
MIGARFLRWSAIPGPTVVILGIIESKRRIMAGYHDGIMNEQCCEYYVGNSSFDQACFDGLSSRNPDADHGDVG